MRYLATFGFGRRPGRSRLLFRSEIGSAFPSMTEPKRFGARAGRASKPLTQEGLILHDEPGGLTVLELSSAQCAGRLALQGAQLLEWAPEGEKPVIWLSKRARLAPGASIRGGIPICWPWFGPHPSEASRPNHGVARTSPWELVAHEREEGRTRIGLRLAETPTTRAHWPHSTRVEMHLELGQALECELVTRNDGEDPVTIGEALHTYLAVGDVRDVSVEGLEGGVYLDKLDGGKRKKQVGALRIDSEIDRVYLESVADCVVRDPVWKRNIRVSKRGSSSTVVWNPWAAKSAAMADMEDDGYLRMLCVESANAADDVVTIPPGGEHRLWVRYDIEDLA